MRYSRRDILRHSVPLALGSALLGISLNTVRAAAQASASPLGIADDLSNRLPAAEEIVLREVGAVIGAHVGPGLLAVVVSPR